MRRRLERALRWRPRSRPTLAQLVVLMMTAVVLIAAVVTALVAASLVRTAAQREARLALGRQADVVASLLDAGRPQNREVGLRALRSQATPVAWVLPNGRVRGDLVPRVMIADRVDELLDGRSLAFDARFRGAQVFVEARPLADGSAIVLSRFATSAIGATQALLTRELIALAVGLLVAILAAAALARWLARPLLTTAAAAGRLAAGEREVRLAPEGPREVAQVAASVNALAAALQSSEARQREFLLSVSHELRTPLTAIRGFAESLADQMVHEPAETEAVGRTMLAESQRLERLVGDLLDLARLGADDFRLDLIDLDLRELLVGAATVWRARCEAVGVAFAVELPATAVLVHADPARVRQVVDGLAENALRVTPAGRPLVLALDVDRASGEAVVAVRDGGPGLTPADQLVAFERSALYERYRGVRKVGTGLGLALVKALTERHAGRVAVGDAPEGGARFEVRLPLLTRPSPG
ncbi:MAG TPA: HAMP domain-containing sensor histidine kinase [Dermatophilaceae bacterium]|nr:HAMP domain-containing sensor histidine kinase [Dermatophilaceae bacterium]